MSKRRTRIPPEARKRMLMYGFAMLLALLNDALDLVGLGVPMFEGLLDLLLAILILSSMPERKFTDVLVALADMVTGIDLAPMWTIYLLYRMEKDPELVKAVSLLKSKKPETRVGKGATGEAPPRGS